ncbi:hypothetical protein BDV06DRAFT_185900 [Aspergillus oleicola]
MKTIMPRKPSKSNDKLSWRAMNGKRCFSTGCLTLWCMRWWPELVTVSVNTVMLYCVYRIIQYSRFAAFTMVTLNCKGQPDFQSLFKPNSLNTPLASLVDSRFVV